MPSCCLYFYKGLERNLFLDVTTEVTEDYMLHELTISAPRKTIKWSTSYSFCWNTCCLSLKEFSCNLWAKTFCHSCSVLLWVERGQRGLRASERLKIPTWHRAESRASTMWVIFKTTWMCGIFLLVLCLSGVPKFLSHCNFGNNSSSVFLQRKEAATSFINLKLE